MRRTLTLALLLLAAVACMRGTTTRVEAAWRTYLDEVYGDPNYVGPIGYLPAPGRELSDIQQLVRTGNLYGRLKAADRGVRWRDLTPRGQQSLCMDAALEAAFTQRFGSPQKGRQYNATGKWQQKADPLAVEWAATVVAIHAEVERTCR